MEFVIVDKTNIVKEDICCAMSNKQSEGKKSWMVSNFDDGLTFVKNRIRGKCFVEYILGENAWIPIEAKNYLLINCFWIAGSLKGKGYSNELLEYVINKAKQEDKDGICVLSSVKKKEFLSNGKYLLYKGFKIADTTECGINLMYLPIKENYSVPKFKECAKELSIKEDGFVIYYTDQCPFTYYWVNRVKEVAKEYGIELKTYKINSKQEAQNFTAPVTTYALFKDGKFVTQAVQSDKKFLKLAGILK